MTRWRPVLRLGSLESPFECWERVVPRIPDEMIECVIYLYESEMDAASGARSGGSGFLVSVPPEIDGAPAALYAVTNSHIIREAASPIVRLNTQAGRTEVIPLTADQWHHHPNGDDLAVCPIGLQEEHHRFKTVPRSAFLSKTDLDQLDIGLGDEVFFVGRYISHEGRQQNVPTARFGNISMMPFEPVRHPRGTLVESFLVEARSLSGYSGSPVFAYIGSEQRYFDWDDSQGEHPPVPAGRARIYLLGVDWGHDADYKAVLESDRRTKVPEGWQVEQNSGIMNVAPVWLLSELLDEPELVSLRRERERRWAEDRAESNSVMDGT
jgi:hypothetical protein